MPDPDDRRTAKAHDAALPSELRDQLDTFRQELWRVKVIESVLAGIFGLLVSFLLVFGLDRFIETPPLARLLILIGGVSLFAFFVPIFLRRWIWGHRSDSQLARLISHRYPGLGDRLLGVVELRSQLADGESLSPALREAAMRNVNREAKNQNLQGALPISRQGRWSAIVVGLFAIAFVSLMLAPQAGMNALKRWLLPLSDTARFTYTELVDVPETIHVPVGEAFPLDLSLTEGSARVPSSASVTFPGDDPITVPRTGDRNYEFILPGQRNVTTLTLKVGDVMEKIRVEPRVRPSLQALGAVITPPEYLRSESREVAIDSGYLSVVAGSRVSIAGEANRALEAITVSLQQKMADAPAPDAPWDGPISLSPDESQFVLPELPINDSTVNLSLTWRDQFGLGNSSPFTLSVESVPDAAPNAYVQGLDRQVVILAQETLEFSALCEDDYGLKNIGIEWSGTHTRPTAEAPAQGELTLEPARPGQRRVNRAVAFSPEAFDISPQRLMLRVWATDDFPDRARSYSQPVVVHILTPDEHAQLVRNRLDRLMSGLEDAARREQAQLDENDLLERNDPEALQADENQDKLREQIAREVESEQRLEELSEQMDELFRDALRNDDIDKDTMKRLAEINQAMRELAEEDLPGVREKLEDSADPRNTPEKAKRDLKDAVERQKQALQKMRDTIEKADDASSRLEANTFVNRLRRAARDQIGIGASLTQSMDDTVGLYTTALKLSQQEGLAEINQDQSTLASDIRWIREDLLSYYNRTQKDEHKTLHDLMADSDIDQGMFDLQRDIGANKTFIALRQTREWAEKLNAWAGKLSELAGAGGGGGGGGGGGPSEQDIEFMLKVMKMIQSEQDLRARTRALEQRRRDFSQPENVG